MKIVPYLYSTNFNPSMPVVMLQVQYQHRTTEVMALVDSGADATILPIGVLQSVHARRIETRHMRGVTGIRKRVGIYTVTIQISSHTIHRVHTIAADTGTEAILGRDILNYLVVTLDGPAGVTEIQL